MLDLSDAACVRKPRGRRLTRRAFLGAGAAALALQPAHGQIVPRGIPFGAAIQTDFFDDAAYRQAFIDECDIVLPMNEFKFGLVQWERGKFDFTNADRLVDFAQQHGKTVRGQPFVWHLTNGPWLETIDNEREATAVLTEHIERTADRFKGRITDWDVVNEVITHDPLESPSAPLRDTFWLRTLGPRYIPLAFRVAADADPTAKLVINDYDLEFVGESYNARRDIMLSIVRQLQDAHLRVDAVGFQAHLYAHQKIDVEATARFKEELRRLGVGIIVTELDVIDFQIQGGPEAQDEAAQVVVSDFLDAVLPGAPPLAVITWGITDRHSWVDGAMPHADGLPSRPLPLDANDRPKDWYLKMRSRLSAS